MKEFSEKELEHIYKDLKMMEIPDMWEGIEGNLAPKKAQPDVEFKRRRGKAGRVIDKYMQKRSIRQIMSVAAVVVIVCLLVPVVSVIQQRNQDAEITGGANTMTDGAVENVAAGGAAESEEICQESVPEEVPEEGAVESDGVQREEAAEMEGALEEETVEAECIPEEAADDVGIGHGTIVFKAELIKVQELENEWLLLVRVAEEAGDLARGEELEISCKKKEAENDTENGTTENNGYAAGDFTDKMHLLVEEKEGKLILVEMIPIR